MYLETTLQVLDTAAATSLLPTCEGEVIFIRLNKISFIPAQGSDFLMIFKEKAQ